MYKMFSFSKMLLPRTGFEPVTYGYLLLLQTTVHRSTNWAIEGMWQIEGTALGPVKC